MDVKRFFSFLLGFKGSFSFAIVLLAVMLTNAAILRSPILGLVTSVVYLVLVGFLLSKAFLGGEEENFVRLAFGIFLAVAMLLFLGVPIVFVYQLNLLSLMVILVVPPIVSVVYTVVRGRREGTSGTEGARVRVEGRYFSPFYIVYFVLAGYCFLLLFQARSGWVYGDVWGVVSPLFYVSYFSLAFILVGIIFYSNTRPASKLLLTTVFGALSFMVFAIVLFPGNYGDPSDHLGWARDILYYGSLRMGHLSFFHLYWELKEKGLALLTATVAKMTSIDAYWVHTLITPTLWSIFVPISAYKITRIIGSAVRTSLLAAFLTTFFSAFVSWGSRSTANSLGFVPFLMVLYFLLVYLKSDSKTRALSLAFVMVVVSLFVHRLTGMMALIFLFLALGMREYEKVKVKSRFFASFLLSVSFLVCIFAIPMAFFLNNVIYLRFAPQYAEEAGTAFSLSELSSSDPWSLIFGEYVDYTFKDFVLSGSVFFLGVLGVAYAFKRRDLFKRTLVLFLFLVLMVCVTDYAIIQYAMINPLFSPSRIWSIRDLIAVPFAALAVNLATEFLTGTSQNPIKLVARLKGKSVKLYGKRLVAGLLIGLALSAFAVSSVFNGYAWLRGLQPTQLEVDAVKYIDEHTDGRYVVFAHPTTTMVGESFFGYNNPAKYYLFNRALGETPSVADLVQHMRWQNAKVGYFVVSSFRTPDVDTVVAEASRVFDLFEVLSNNEGIIYIFKYEIPPFPGGLDDLVSAFYWSTPRGYYIQNGLFRVIVYETGHSLDVRDFWGDLYESINFDETLLDGKPVGEMTSIEYFEPQNNTWINWSPESMIPSAQSFKFRLLFDTGSLVGAMERSMSLVQLSWEGVEESNLSLEVGDFKRLYIPGLVESSDVRSREYGFLYTLCRTNDVMLQPAYGEDAKSSYLSFNEVSNYCNLTITEGYLYYDLYVVNEANIGQWASVEMWLPDVVYQGTFPPFAYSPDGGSSWSQSLTYTNFPKGIPIRTIGGEEVNWIFTRSGNATARPIPWRAFTAASGGQPILPESFTQSGGGQNRFFFGLYLPPNDKALLRVGISVYYSRPLKITYVFTDSDHISYGLFNMKNNSIKLYNLASSSYVGGWESTQRPSSLRITEDETGTMKSIQITLPSNNVFSLFATKDVDTTVDADNDGIPDLI